jgi:hypothetical protein
MCANAPGMPPHVCARQGRRGPTPRFPAAGAGGVTKAETYLAVARPAQSYGQRPELVEITSPRGITCHCTGKAGNISSVLLYIYRVALLSLNNCPPAGLPEAYGDFFAAGAGGVTASETCASAAARLRQATRTRRRYIAARVTYLCADKTGNITLLRRTSAELLYSCCGSVAAPRLTAWAPRPSSCGAQRAAPRATAWVPRSKTFDAQRAARRETAWVPRSSTCDAQRAAPRVAAWAPRPSTCDAQRAAPRART